MVYCIAHVFCDRFFNRRGGSLPLRLLRSTQSNCECFTHVKNVTQSVERRNFGSRGVEKIFIARKERYSITPRMMTSAMLK
jgi:hypothetical protein